MMSRDGGIFIQSYQCDGDAFSMLLDMNGIVDYNKVEIACLPIGLWAIVDMWRFVA